MTLQAFLISAAVALAVQNATAGVEPPSSARAVIREAVRAVEGDSVGRVRARWATRRRTDPGDRTAALGLATLARLTYDYANAERQYAALSAAPASDAVARYALLGAGWAAYSRGQNPRADTLFGQARVASLAARDGAAEAASFAGLAMTRGPILGAPAGAATLDSARRLAPPGDDALAADLAVRRTVFLAVLSDPRAAAEGANARALARRAGDRRTEALAMRALALDLHLRGEDDSALVALTETERLQRDARDHGTLAETLIRHADIYHGRSDYGRMQTLMLQAVPEAEVSGNLYALAAAYVGLGVVDLGFGDFGSARAHFDEAAARYVAQADSSGLMITRTNQANLALVTGDLARARMFATQVRDFHHRTSDASEEFEILRVLAAIERRAGAYPAASAWLDNAAALSRRRDRTWTFGLDRDRAALALARGDLPEARRRLTTYLANIDTADHAVRHRAREMLAEVAARSGDDAGAARELTAAGDEVDAWRATLSNRALRTLAFQARGYDWDVGGSSAPAVIAVLAAHGRTTAAYEVAERRRARALADRLARAAALATAPPPLAPPPLAHATSPALLNAAPNQSGVAAAADVLADGHTALLEYVAGGTGVPTTVFVLTRDAGGQVVVRSRALPPSDSLAPRAARLAALLEAGADPVPLAQALGDAVLAPALADLPLGARHLVIVPDGPLHLLPFDALRTRDGGYVVERYAVSIAPSAVVASALMRRTAPGVRPVRLLAFGDPTFARPTGAAGGAGGSDDAKAFRSAFDSSGGLARLAGSGDEARAVARYAPSAEVRIGDAATAAYLKHAALAPFDVIHFATHALVDDRSVAHTALALAPGGGENGFVSAGDLAALHLAARLVVLSACRSAGGMVVDGEGVQGLTAPLLEAGAQSVVATEWRIGDRHTAEFVDAFYDHLARGLPVADALQAAKRDAIRRGAPPAEWAAFTVVGDGSARVPLRLPAPPLRWPLVASGVLLVAAGAVHRTRRRPASPPPAAA